jgi:ATP-dependent exoDNAse (exonuclease V) beta subunit
VLGVIAEPSMALCASAVAAEAARLIGTALVRTRDGQPRPARPDDIAVLFRARHGHQYFEAALEERGIRTYVYKGLGFFDAPEVQDLQALMRFLAEPDSDLRAAEFPAIAVRAFVGPCARSARARLFGSPAGRCRAPAGGQS